MGMSGVFLAGGRRNTKTVRPGFFAARNPLWSPDGSICSLKGVDKFTAAEASSRYDWYVAALDSGALVKTGALMF